MKFKITKLLLLLTLMASSSAAWAGIVNIQVTGSDDPVTPGTCQSDAIRSGGNEMNCPTLRSAINYINDPTHCLRDPIAGASAESLSYVINVPDGSMSLGIQNIIADRNHPNASLDFGSNSSTPIG
ncbi:MAG: hypothetical protein HQM15_07605 [Deltaproteobacteria bacterium]|nr:hypothetical protein [Deltaproteobacteria bacterium]